MAPRPEGKKGKTKQYSHTNYSVKVGSVHALLPAEAGPAVLITESGGPHRCPSNTADRCLQDPGFPHQLFFFFSIPQRVFGMEGILPLASSKMPSKQRMFSEPAKILEPMSWRTEHQVGSRNPEYLMQESCPLEIIDLQRSFFNLKGKCTIQVLHWEKKSPIPSYPPTPRKLPQPHQSGTARGTDTLWQ